jgi:hypothetical protein
VLRRADKVGRVTAYKFATLTIRYCMQNFNINVFM